MENQNHKCAYETNGMNCHQELSFWAKYCSLHQDLYNKFGILPCLWVQCNELRTGVPHRFCAEHEQRVTNYHTIQKISRGCSWKVTDMIITKTLEAYAKAQTALEAHTKPLLEPKATTPEHRCSYHNSNFTCFKEIPLWARSCADHCTIRVIPGKGSPCLFMSCDQERRTESSAFCEAHDLLVRELHRKKNLRWFKASWGETFTIITKYLEQERSQPEANHCAREGCLHSVEPWADSCLQHLPLYQCLFRDCGGSVANRIGFCNTHWLEVQAAHQEAGTTFGYEPSWEKSFQWITIYLNNQKNRQEEEWEKQSQVAVTKTIAVENVEKTVAHRHLSLFAPCCGNPISLTTNSSEYVCACGVQWNTLVLESSGIHRVTLQDASFRRYGAEPESMSKDPLRL